MLTAYTIGPNGPADLPVVSDTIGPEASWVDLFSPTAGEEALAEAFLGTEIPTREETQEIEFSSRFYVEDGVVVMTASLLSGVDDGEPALTPFSFAIGKRKIVTLRYANPVAFRQFMARAAKPDMACTSPNGVFVGLLEAFIDRTADVLERITQAVDKLNGEIFMRRANTRPNGRRLSVLISGIGFQGDLASKVRESLASMERLIQFAATMVPDPNPKSSGQSARLKLALRDTRSLEDHVNFVLNKITFLLDATLGLVTNEQNQVLGVLTIVSTILLPPMLIGTIYGMNFRDMPELNWQWAYPVALGAMVISAVIPFVYFKWRRWL
ncbi:magnesium transporter CorA family protein [Kaistia dalseonensis]|uniref:Magnesium transporter n=1 Tax=Kaistia dalseonensis TaxID=410840 RepID=A0ABU0H6P3_9HYPH|nr:magnesium transporter CorA family protein [Kaistia dalseonensis]MCX5495115.1 magnesium transporter CorA family protein [Kaistia dalseonensis]MDQ0437697.1 magnesium transporter [Kaistia dalseonensis]